MSLASTWIWVKIMTLAGGSTMERTSLIFTVTSRLNSCVNWELAQLNGLQPLEHGISVHVYMRDVNEGRNFNNQEFVRYTFKADQIPQFVKDAYDYDNRLSKNVSYGLNIPIEN
jgi:hypothetical protein